LNRPLEAEPFGPDEVELLQALVPHLARAVRLRAQREVGRQAPPSFLVTPQLRLLLANAGAEALVRARGGFRVRGGCLHTPYDGDQGELRRIVGAVRAMGVGDEAAWTARVRGAEPESAFLVQASPSGFGLEQVLLTVRELRPPQQLVPGRLRAILKLTPAEIRLVCSLWQTANLVTTARDLEISINTAKRQLQSVFGKTGTSNQPSLFKLLAMLHPAG
jgi:DNA-binding CsgD family transcriptional regulator